MTREEKERKMIDIVTISFAMHINDVTDKYGITPDQLRYWKRKLIKEGKIDPEALLIKPPTVNSHGYIIPDVTQADPNDVEAIFADKAFKSRMKAIKRMDELIKEEVDLDKITRAFKAIHDSIKESPENSELNKFVRKNSIFDAAKLISENMDEIVAKQNQLKN